ncbi:MAG: hypothetical protein KAX38_00060, partial [Candidatus Krumholzibacteria bacterium]|nr:hypothetical protein [Candidatus Krumholzibacteria bacterium]
KSVSVDCTGLGTTEELVGKVKERVPEDADLVVELSITGLIGTDAVIDPALVLDELGGNYFSVRLSGKRPEREISKDDLLKVPEGTVAGKFVRVLLERIEEASGNEREELEEALQIGYQLFRGRSPLG